jgi:hypothetical protein
MQDFDARWQRWQKRGRLHDSRLRRRWMIATPALLAVAAMVWVFLIR